MDYKAPQPLVQAVLDYLSVRPYREVVHLVEELLKLEPLEEVGEDPPSGDS